jgi:hypothetical protein
MKHRTLVMLGSREPTAAQVRVALKVAPAFLMDLANLQPSKAAVDRLVKKYPSQLPGVIFTDEVFDRIATMGWKPRTYLPTVEPNLDASVETPSYWIPLYLSRFFLRITWDAPDTRTKSWRIFWLRLFYKELRDVSKRPPDDIDLLEPPAFTPFDVAMMVLHSNLYKALICRNADHDCPSRYFFSSKKGQKYCSDGCAHTAQKEYKRKWWADVGSQRRKEQQ